MRFIGKEDIEMETKKPWQSKTILLNGVFGLLAFVALFIPGAEGVHQLLVGHAAEITMAWSVLNIVLRAITKDKIALVD